MSRGRKYEEKQITFALYSQVVREGGLHVPVIMRFSAIPGHCESFCPLYTRTSSCVSSSYYRRVRDVRDERMALPHLGHDRPPEAARRRLPRRQPEQYRL